MIHQRKKDRVLESLSQSSIEVNAIHWQAQAPPTHRGVSGARLL